MLLEICLAGVAGAGNADELCDSREGTRPANYGCAHFIEQRPISRASMGDAERNRPADGEKASCAMSTPSAES